MLVGLDGQALATLRASGQPIPAPISGRGLIDTASDITCVTSAVLNRINPTRIGSATTNTMSGSLKGRIFEVSVGIPSPRRGIGPLALQERLLVMEWQQPLPGIDVLIGLDLLAECVLLFDGPRREFTVFD